jgi:hypothetical protein
MNFKFKNVQIIQLKRKAKKEKDRKDKNRSTGRLIR